MASLSSMVSTLELRRDALLEQISRIDRRLTIVAKMTGSTGQTRERAASQKSRTAAKRGRHTWFARGEASAFLRKAARTPKTAANLVRELALAKGHSDQVSTAEWLLFQTAAFMAVNHAVKSGVLKRRTDGSLVVRRSSAG